MRDQLDAQIWVDNHEAFSAGIDRALSEVHSALHRFAAWDGTTHQLLALLVAFGITALTFNTTTTAGEGISAAAKRHHRRDRQGRVDAGIVERQRTQLIRGAHIADPRRLQLYRGAAGRDLDGIIESTRLEDGVEPS